jgi:glucose-6-phosphate 1-dehydrogenase
MRRPEDCLLVIFGASGDLTARKLVPALYDLCRTGLLPERFAVVGVGRTALSDDAFRERMVEAIRRSGGGGTDEAGCLGRFLAGLFYQQLDTADPGDYGRLRDRLLALDAQVGTGGNFIYYLATPPAIYEVAALGLADQGLAREADGGGCRRIIVEKPFGHDLESARSLNRVLQGFFAERQIYRIDHYLGKETVQNLLVFRFSNGIFEPLWNRNHVHDVQILAAEDMGVEGRGSYYDSAGALRDMFQNHLLQLLGIVAMEPPATMDATALRNETLKVFQALRPIAGSEVARNVVRGQYAAGMMGRRAVAAYRDERGVAPDSATETFVALRLFVDNWRWGGVPFFVRTGKRLAARVTEVVINFRETPHCLFGQACRVGAGHNQLVLRIQPDEGMSLRFAMKVPGAGFDVRDVAMDFRYAALAEAHVPGPYERLLLDCMLGDATLYARSDAVEACWAFTDPIVEAWAGREAAPPFPYAAGTWGPAEADALLAPHEAEWRQPGDELDGGAPA